MLTQTEKFKIWFCEFIEDLYEKRNAGFAILMLTFPLLERYLRAKSKTPEKSGLGEPFYTELVILFPVLKDNSMAKEFWQVYRNGILHQVTLSAEDNKGTKMPGGWLSGDKKDIEVDASNAFWVNPVDFAKKVIGIIDKDFSNFEARDSQAHQLAKEQITPDGYDGTCGSGVKI
jgi:hypothetical protein